VALLPPAASGSPSSSSSPAAAAQCQSLFHATGDAARRVSQVHWISRRRQPPEQQAPPLKRPRGGAAEEDRQRSAADDMDDDDDMPDVDALAALCSSELLGCVAAAARHWSSAIGSAAGSEVDAGANRSLRPCVWNLRRARRLDLPLDVSAPLALWWMRSVDFDRAAARLKPVPRAAGDVEAADAEEEEVAACSFSGTLFGKKRPRLLCDSSPPLPMHAGCVSGEAVLAAIRRRGNADARIVARSPDRSRINIEVPFLRAKVLVNCAVKTPLDRSRPPGCETVIEAPTSEARHLLAEVLEGLLQPL